MRFIVVLLIFSCHSFSQEVTKHYIDSLVINHQNNIEDKFEKEFLTLGNTIGRQDNALELFKYLDSVSKNKPKIRLSFYNKYVSYLYRTGQKAEGLKLNGEGFRLAKKYKYKRILFEYAQLKSYGYTEKETIDSALYYANEAEKIILQNKDVLGNKMNTVFMRKAMIEVLLGNSVQRDLYYEKAVESLEPHPEDSQNAYILSAVVHHFKQQKNYAKHAYYAQKLKTYYLKRDGFSNPEKHISISRFLEFENTEEEVEELKKIVKFSKDSTLTIDQLYFINQLSESLIKTGKHDEAIFYLKKQLKTDSIIPSYIRLRSYALLQNSYLYKEDCDNALAIIQKKTKLIDSLRTQQMINKIAESKVKYETEKKAAQLQILKLEKQKEKQKKNLFLIIALLGLFLVGLTAYFLYKNNLKNKKLNSQNVILERTIDEKNVLLKEVHHRVKNSFQIVSSLLYLQSENVTDKNAKLAIKEAENRVRSMVLVHQKLYKEDDLIGVNSKEYISDLVKDIFESHGPQEQSITYNLDIEPIVLDIETITPLGLILNELIINTMKHAFIGLDKEHTIHVDFAKADDKLVLKVIDNGKGFEGNIKQSSFGISLMKGLSKQLKASLNYHSKLKEGTQVILSISKFNILS